MTTETEFANDVFQVLSFIIQHTHIATNDPILAALARIRAAGTTELESSAQRLADLIARRTRLIPDRNGLRDKRGQLADVVYRMEKFPGGVKPRDIALAKSNLARAAAELEACVKELAQVETAINEIKPAARDAA
jgi:hypothetical protein